MQSLAKYVGGVAIGNQRILEVSDDAVIFDAKDYRDQKHVKVKLPPIEFCKRLALHVLPRSLARIRYAGLFAVAHRKTLLLLSRKLLGEKRAAEEEALKVETETLFAEVEEASVQQADHDDRCHKCQGKVELHQTLSPTLTVAILAIAQWMIAWRNEKIPAAEAWTPTLAVLRRILTVKVARGSRNTVALSLTSDVFPESQSHVIELIVQAYEHLEREANGQPP